MARKLIVGGLAAIVVLAGGWYFASPIYALHSLRTAAAEGDAGRLEQLVDFPAVREGLKSQLSAMLAASFENDPKLKSNPFAAVALQMVPAFVERGVDAMVTPQAISRMVLEGKAAPSAAAPAEPAPAGPAADPVPAAAPPAAPAKPRAPAVSYGYRDLNTFAVTSQAADDRRARLDFVFRRQGLFGWRMTRIDLPADALDLGAGRPGG